MPGTHRWDTRWVSQCVYEIAIRDKYGDNVIVEDLEHHALHRPIHWMEMTLAHSN